MIPALLFKQEMSLGVGRVNMADKVLLCNNYYFFIYFLIILKFYKTILWISEINLAIFFIILTIQLFIYTIYKSLFQT